MSKTLREMFDELIMAVPFTNAETKYIPKIKVALEKQIPKKPIPRFINTFSDEMAISCPCCKEPIVNVWNKRDYKPLYCHYCGQALDWSDTE